jgi:tetratricopeptide (TPR) repeat protein
MGDLADMYEKLENLPKSLECLETAIQWYKDEGIHATANKARQKAGQLAAMLGDYYKAVNIFVTGAEASLSTGPTGRFIVKTYLFKAGSKLSLRPALRVLVSLTFFLQSASLLREYAEILGPERKIY